MSSEDFRTLQDQEAADIALPEAILSNSGMILGLAKLPTKDILKKRATQRLR